MRDSAELTVKELMGRVERAERELGSKTEVVHGFIQDKRSEIDILKNKIKEMTLQLRMTELKLEEVWSKGAWVTADYFNTVD